MYNRVMFIDDDHVTHIIYKTIAQAIGFCNQLMQYEFAEDALFHLKSVLGNAEISQVPDLIFVDLHMPDMNGWQFCNAVDELLYQVQKAIPVYLLTSSIDPIVKVKAKEFLCIQGIIEKPIQAPVLVSLLEKRN